MPHGSNHFNWDSVSVIQFHELGVMHTASLTIWHLMIRPATPKCRSSTTLLNQMKKLHILRLLGLKYSQSDILHGIVSYCKHSYMQVCT